MSGLNRILVTDFGRVLYLKNWKIPCDQIYENYMELTQFVKFRSAVIRVRVEVQSISLVFRLNVLGTGQ